MELPINNELVITNDAVKYAKIIAAPVENEFQRKRAYASIVALDTFADYLVTQGIVVNISKNLFKIAPVNEEFEISDLYYNGWKVEVRIVSDNNFISVPKSHFKYDILADFYVGIKVDSQLKKAQLAGFVSREQISRSLDSGDYYLMSSDALCPIEDLINIISSENHIVAPFDHSDFENYYLSYIDKEIDNSSKKSFIKHLVNCPECRANFVELYDFEAIVKNMSLRTEFFEDHTLSIIGAQAVDSEKYVGKEEIIEINPLETGDELDEEDILGELFDNPSDKMIEKNPKDKNGGAAIGLAAGVLGAGAVIAGTAAAASAQSSVNAVISGVEAASSVAEAGASIAESAAAVVESGVKALSPTINHELTAQDEDITDFLEEIGNENSTLIEDDIFDLEQDDTLLIEEENTKETVAGSASEPHDELADLNAKNGEYCDLSSFEVELLPTPEERNKIVIEDSVIPLLPEDESAEVCEKCDCLDSIDDLFEEHIEIADHEFELNNLTEQGIQPIESETVEELSEEPEFNFLKDADDIFKEFQEQDELESALLHDGEIDDEQSTSDFLADLSKTLDETIVELEEMEVHDCEALESSESEDILQEEFIEDEELTEFDLSEDIHNEVSELEELEDFSQDLNDYEEIVEETKSEEVEQASSLDYQTEAFEEDEDGELVTLSDEEDDEFPANIAEDTKNTEQEVDSEDNFIEFSKQDDVAAEASDSFAFEPSEFLQDETESSDEFKEFINAGNELKSEEEVTSFDNSIQLTSDENEDIDLLTDIDEDDEEGDLEVISDDEDDKEEVETVQIEYSQDDEESDFEEYIPAAPVNNDQQDLQLLYKNSNNLEMPDEVDEQIEYIVNKPDGLSIMKDKKVIIASSLIVGCLLLSSVFGVIAYNNKMKNDSEAISEQVQEPMSPMLPDQTGAMPVENGEFSIAGGESTAPVGMELAKGSTASAPRDLNKSMTNVFDENPSTITITKISWEVPQYIATSELFTKYLQIAGKNLQINLKNDLLNATEFAYNDGVKVLIEVGKDNNIKKLEVLNSSGSQQVDEIVLQSIKATLKYINVPQLPDSAELGQNNPVMNKLLKANVYPLTLVINF